MGQPAPPSVPRVGMLARIRNRRGMIAGVAPYDGETGRLHLVEVEYKDHDAPHGERLLWELEPGRELLEPSRLPQVRESAPMPAEDFDALLRAARWTALMPYLDPDGKGLLGRQPVSSPLHSAVRVEDYQLEPLLRALLMPRVNLLIADDVGLGKTVEAGLILKELLLRRRIRRVLVLAPAALRLQWRDELQDKFALPFEIVDRGSTEALRRDLGIDANPWRSFSRIVASYHYLRQPDIQEQFLAASRTTDGSPHLPWDLLIVDECHNLMPSPFGADSELCQMLRRVAPCFEHRLFLSATPHNGHTRSFTGLLEILDPVRFSQTDELSAVQQRRARELVVRRLKRELNEQDASPRFCERKRPRPLLLHRDSAEGALSAAFAAFRKAVRRSIAAGHASERAGTFAIEILGKRLLSCPTAFADSWYRTREGYTRARRDAEAATDADVAAVRRSVERETSDDRETEQRTGTAAGVVGAWLRNVAASVEREMAAIDAALAELGFDPNPNSPPTVEQDPNVDARLAALTGLIEELLLRPGAGAGAATASRSCGSSRSRAGAGAGGAAHASGSVGQAGQAPAFRDDERLVVFTEYKTTLDYLERRLRERYDSDDSDGGDGGDDGGGSEPDSGSAFRVLTLFGSGGAGGMDDAARARVRAAFNDPDSSVRILVATDAASEGLNLHRSARYLLHYDCPWNPSRLEQRNGRLDRYGQARDVTVYHFLSDDDPDLKFLDHVIRKANEIREDLGSVNELFDTAAHRRLVEGADPARVQFELDHGITRAQERVRDQGIPGLFGSAGVRDGDTRPAAVVDEVERGHELLAAVPSASARSGHRGNPAVRPHASADSLRQLGAGTVEQSKASDAAQAPGEAGPGPDTAFAPGLAALAREIDFHPAALRQTLETAMAMTGGRPQLDRLPGNAAGDRNDAGADELWRLLHPDLPGWRDTIDESLRLASRAGVAGPVRRLAFDAGALLRRVNGRAVFSPRPEVALLHLAHPLIDRALRVLALRRLPGPAEAARWTVRRGGVPHGVDALILLSLEELAVNELRETFHHWVRTIVLPVRGGALEDALPHLPHAPHAPHLPHAPAPNLAVRGGLSAGGEQRAASNVHASLPASLLLGSHVTHVARDAPSSSSSSSSGLAGRAPDRSRRAADFDQGLPADGASRTQGDPEVSRTGSLTPAEMEQARAIFLHLEADLEAVVRRRAQNLTDSLQAQLKADGAKALQDANERYRSRQGEVSALIEKQSVERLEREIDTLGDSTQGRLFDQRRDLERTAESIQEKRREIERRRRHYREAREQLERERQRIVERLLPKRHALADKAQVFPVTVEVRLP